MKKENVKTGGMLLAWFAHIGCFTFGGGWSILAQMDQEFIQRRELISKEELLELTAMGRSLPGIIITNISMLFGCRVAGWFGGVCAVCGMALPSVVILSLVTACYDLLKTNLWCWSALRGVSAAVVPIIASAMLSLGKEAFRHKSGVWICLITFVPRVLTGWSNILLPAFFAPYSVDNQFPKFSHICVVWVPLTIGSVMGFWHKSVQFAIHHQFVIKFGVED